MKQIIYSPRTKTLQECADTMKPNANQHMLIPGIPYIEWVGSHTGERIDFAANLPPHGPAAVPAWSALPCDTRQAV